MRLPTRMRCAWSICAPVPCKRRTRRDTAWVSSPGWTSGQYPVSQQNPVPRTRRFTRPTSTRPCRCALPARMKPWSGFWTSLASTAPTVSGASPCPHLPTTLMAPVAAKLERALAAVSMVPPAVPYLSNVGGRALRDPEEIRDDLAQSVEWPVRWHDATTLLFELGVRLFVELPPAALTDLATVAFPRLVRSLSPMLALARPSPSSPATTNPIAAHRDDARGGTVYLPGELQSGTEPPIARGRLMKVICRCVPVLPHRELLGQHDRKILLC